MHRRGFLTVASLSLLSGCGGWFGGPDSPPAPGTLLLVNDDENDHTVTVALQKMSRRETDVPTYSWDADNEPPTEEPLWRTEETFEVPAGGTVERPEFVAEGGSYYLEATVAGFGTLDVWLRFRNGDDGLWGRVPRVRITDHDQFSLTAEDTGRVAPPATTSSASSLSSPPHGSSRLDASDAAARRS